jgi:hypothetical protein
MITESNREEFQNLDVDEVRKRVKRHTYDAEKERQAREWLRENEPAWISARAAQGAVRRSTFALVISGLSLIVAAVALWKGLGH